MNKKKVIHPLSPIYDDTSQILLLGSLPSVKSREENFYYAHPQNRFWKVLAILFKEPFPTTKQEKTNLVLKHHVAIWDVIHSCYINGSSDASISDVKANDIAALIKKTNIKAVFTTGNTAKKYYDKYCYPNTKIEAINLPSTSTANASYSLEKLVEAYQIILDYLSSSNA